MVRGGSDFKVDIKRDYRRDRDREYFMGLKVQVGQEWSEWFQLKFKGSTST